MDPIAYQVNDRFPGLEERFKHNLLGIFKLFPDDPVVFESAWHAYHYLVVCGLIGSHPELCGNATVNVATMIAQRVVMSRLYRNAEELVRVIDPVTAMATQKEVIALKSEFLRLNELIRKNMHVESRRVHDAGQDRAG